MVRTRPGCRSQTQRGIGALFLDGFRMCFIFVNIKMLRRSRDLLVSHWISLDCHYGTGVSIVWLGD